MNKPRKVTLIKELKREVNFYKNMTATVSAQYFYESKLNRLQLNVAFSRNEIQLSEDEIDYLLKRKMTDAFREVLPQIPIETRFDQYFQIYRARLDLWVKPN